MPILYPGHPALTPLSSRHFTVQPHIYIQSISFNDSSSMGDPGYDLGDQLLEFEIQEDLDNAVGTFTCTFARGKGTQSLSPFMFGGTRSYIGTRATFQPHHMLSIQTYISGINMPPLFIGRIDNADYAPGGDKIIVTGRDMGAYLSYMTLFQKMYGSDGGTELRTVLGEMLTDMGTDESILNDVVTGFSVLPYPQDLSPGFEALRVAAQQIGWDIRWVPGDYVGMKFKLYDPDRERLTVDTVLRMSRYDGIKELKLGDEDVRNWWRIRWKDLNGTVNGPVEVEDADSIAKYGRRYAQVMLDRADLIRTEEAATNFVNAALADSKDPFATHRVDLPFYPDIVLNDVHVYEANGRDYDTDQRMAVVGYKHSWSSQPDTMPTTTIACRGQPIAAYREYRLSRAPRYVVATTPADDFDGMPEGTTHFQVTDLAP